MKVVVFGATGTIGRPLVEQLAQMHEVTAVSRNAQPDGADVTWVQADATVAESGRPRARGRGGRLLPRPLARGDRLRGARPAGGGDDRPGGRASRREAARLPRRPGRRLARPLAAPAQPARDRAPPGLDLGARDDAARRDRDRPRQRRLRDDRLARRPSARRWSRRAGSPPATSRSRSTTSSPTSPASAGWRTPSARSSTPAGRRCMTYREMMERIAVLRGKRPLHRRGAGADAVPLVALAPRCHAGQGGYRPPADRRLRNETVAHDDRIRELVPIELTPFDVAVREALAAR